MKECIHYHHGIEKEERFRVYWRVTDSKGKRNWRSTTCLSCREKKKKKDKEEDKKKAKQQKKRGERENLVSILRRRGVIGRMIT